MKDDWAKLFNAKTWEEVEAITADEIQEVKKEMTFIMSQPTERERIWARQMAIWDHNSMVADAKEEGRKEGLDEGRNEGRNEEKAANIRALMERLKMTAEEAMDTLAVPKEEQHKYLQLVKKAETSAT